MTGYLSATPGVESPEFGHAWRRDDGQGSAAVYLGPAATLIFDSAAEIRALMAPLAKALLAMEMLDAEPELDRVMPGDLVQPAPGPAWLDVAAGADPLAIPANRIGGPS